MGCISFIVKRGKLSEIDIDTDKIWRDNLGNPRGISHIKEVAALMSTGALVEHDGDILVPFYPSLDGYVCTSQGYGKMLTWAPAGGTLKYYFPFTIALSHALAKPAVDRTYNRNAPLIREYKMAYLDAPADMIKRLTPEVASIDAEAVIPVDRSHNINAPIGRDISILIDGAVSETAAGVQTDETAAARSGAVNDMHLCPMTPAVNDKYYFGFLRQYRRLWLYVSTAGAGNWANTVYYWNGAWTAVAGEDDQTSDFTTAGIRRIDWTMPGDWVQSVIMGMNLYWIRVMTTAFVNQTQAPLGAQAWCCLVA